MHQTSLSRLGPRAIVLSTVLVASAAAGVVPSSAQALAAAMAGVVSGETDAVELAVTLTDTAAARDLASQLPVTLEMADRFGQAVVGRLPDELDYVGVGLVRDPEAGHLYYSPSDGSIAVLTADLGPSIPAPGLVDLGVVDSGLEELSSAGSRFEMAVRPAS